VSRAEQSAASNAWVLSWDAMVSAVVSVPLNVAAVPPVPTAEVRVSRRSTPTVPETATAPEITGRQDISSK